jgi:transposase
MSSVAVIGLDIHKNFSKAVKMDSGGKIVGEAVLKHPGRLDFEKFLRNLDTETDVVMEATFNWPWIADLVEELGHRPRLAHPMRAREMAKGMAKSDRKDAIFLGKLFLAGEIFPESYLAPQDVRMMRDVFCVRLLFVRMRTKLKNNIHGQLFRCGLVLDEEVSDLFSPKGLAILKKLDLPEHERNELDRKLLVLSDLEHHIRIVGAELKEKIKHDEQAKLLMSLPGVGEITAYTFLAEIGEIGRFPNGRALASYAGVLPLKNESGGKDFGSRTSKMSNRFLRWAAIEAVTGAVRKSPRMRGLHSRVKAKNKNKAGKARVAVARELMELVHLVLSRRVQYDENPPPRPGSERRVQKECKKKRLPGSHRQYPGTLKREESIRMWVKSPRRSKKKG